MQIPDVYNLKLKCQLAKLAFVRVLTSTYQILYNDNCSTVHTQTHTHTHASARQKFSTQVTCANQLARTIRGQCKSLDAEGPLTGALELQLRVGFTEKVCACVIIQFLKIIFIKRANILVLDFLGSLDKLYSN